MKEQAVLDREEAREFVRTMYWKADYYLGKYPLWYEWALGVAYLAGKEEGRRDGQESRQAQGDQVAEPHSAGYAQGLQAARRG